MIFNEPLKVIFTKREGETQPAPVQEQHEKC